MHGSRPTETGAGAPLTVRAATAADSAAVAAIYGFHVTNGRGSFELESPSQAEIDRRRAAVEAAGLPYLVASDGDGVVGFAYASPHHSRPGYRFTADVSVYVSVGAQRRGVGRLLLGELLVRCEAAGMRQLVAIVGDSGNVASTRLHEALGFREVGRLHAVGRKHGRWLDTVILQLALGEGSATPPGAEADS